MAEYNATGKTTAPGCDEHQEDAPVTVRCITGEFRDHVKTKYRNSPQHASRFRNLCTTLEDEHGDEPADQFGPIKLANLRDLFVAGGNNRNYPVPKPKPKETSEKKSFSDEDLEMAKWILSKILEAAPKLRAPNLDRWADDVQLMRTADGHTIDEIS